MAISKPETSKTTLYSMLYGKRRDNLRHKALERWIHSWGVSVYGCTPGCGRHASDSNGRDAKKRLDLQMDLPKPNETPNTCCK